ncbi:hypothetical protein CYR55_05705 [Chimaeribacter californicus]|uniref:Thiaminase-2/PQQC domain-containing protein n=1 Tax=Chimaeribacter californicus TaxID=2060067 RepID=A0A2N5EE31_9GAMM|nr:iron-containing redox enzyme family protein [Chimaeribacter californicus]PLR40774.1 hypothetical protein CYR55_05705 [Chimaeribacter californicus]
MEQWSLGHFVKPTLNTAFLAKNENGTIEIGEAEAELEISATQPDAIFSLLERLRLGDQQAWKSIQGTPQDEELALIIGSLNEYGFIRETAPEHTPARKEAILATALDEAEAALRPYQPALTAPLRTLLDRALNAGEADFIGLIREEKNAFLLYASLSLISWKTLCPPAVRATALLMQRMLGEEPAPGTIDFTAFWSGEVRRCLSLIVWALVRSQAPDAARKPLPPLPIDQPDSGTNLALRLERWALHCLASFGESRFAPALRTNAHGAQKSLIEAVYAQEYYITERFIDLVSAAIALRLPRPLKKLLRRYYSEEMGHESYELRTCLALGLSEDELHSALPTPFAQLLCDTYTWLAGHHVVAYAAAATITEGLPGQPNIINEAVATSGLLTAEVNESSRKHEALNEKLFHPYISRLLLAECGEQSVDTQEIARDCYGLLLEMTWRTWEELEKLHVRQGRPSLNYRMQDFL